MNYYINITLLPDAEMPTTVLMNAICIKLHKILFDWHTTTIGISFPQFGITLGNVLRIHGNEADLKKLLGMNWLGGMIGYCNLSSILLVPANTKYRTVGRTQPTMSHSKLNRLLKRNSISENEVKAYKVKMVAKKCLDKPFLNFVSGSNGHRHRRYIELGGLLEKPVVGNFDQFGLSKAATVPWF